MNVEIGAEAALFPEKEYIKGIFVTVYFSWMVNSGTYYGLSLSASNPGGNPYYKYLILYVL